MNKYLEKCASIIGGAVATHLVQNLATRTAFKSPSVGKSIANSFANGLKGGHESGVVPSLKRIGRSVAVPDVEIAHREATRAGIALRDHINPLPDRAKAGLRMLSEGRVDAYQKLKNRIPEESRSKIEGIARNVNLPVDKVKGLKEMWRSPDHPMLSNVVSRLGRGKAAESIKPGMPSHKPGTVAAALSSVADVGGGALSTAKMLTQSKRVQESSIGKKLIGKAHEILLRNPVKKGFTQGTEGKVIKGLSRLKEVGYDLGVNSTSASLKRSSSSAGRLLAGKED